MIRARTISEALFETIESDAGEYVFHLEDGSVRLSCAELAERARRGARRLLAIGVEPGDAVGVLGPNRPEWVVSAFSVWLAGAAVVPVQKRLRIPDPDTFAEQLHIMLEAVGCARVLVDPELASLLPPGAAVVWDEDGVESNQEPPSPSPADAAVIQLTSGSTSAPRGALATHAAVMSQMDILDEFLTVNGQGRTTISWTPYFHDLGLFMNVIPAAIWGLTSHHLPTERFARDPVEWFRLAAESRASFTLAPSSAFGNTLRALRRRGERIDLGAMEMARFGTEGIDPNVVERLLQQAPGLNMRPETFGSSYGLAEGVLIVALSAPGSGLCGDRICLDTLASEGVAAPSGARPSRELFGCGMPKVALRIAGPGGDMPDRHVGEILLRGPSLMSRYVGPEAPDPFVDGWLRTGDMGYLADSQLYVTGRVKDMVIVGGDNFYPEDFEWAAGRVEGVRPGRCAAFTKPEANEIVVLVEPIEAGSARGLAKKVRNAVADAVGIAPAEVVVLPPGTIRKTTSGKLRRAAMRDLYAGGELTAVG